MFTLTEKRLSEIEPILEQYRSTLFSTRTFRAQEFEREIRNSLSTGYRELKSIAVQLLKKVRYREVAVYYMEHCDTSVPSEFKRPLAEVYGIKRYDIPDRESKQQEYWSLIFDSGDSNQQDDQ